MWLRGLGGKSQKWVGSDLIQMDPYRAIQAQLEVEDSFEMVRETRSMVMLGRLASQRALLKNFEALEMDFCNF